MRMHCANYNVRRGQVNQVVINSEWSFADCFLHCSQRQNPFFYGAKQAAITSFLYLERYTGIIHLSVHSEK